MAPGLQCANESCAPLPALPPAIADRLSIANCCTRSGDCGTSIDGGECRFTPDSLPDCPEVEVLGFMIPNCCTDQGRCGIDLSALNEGCYSLEAVIERVGARLALPQPAGCEPR
jgi:hypothetical protein